jgi:hypothetical protein
LAPRLLPDFGVLDQFAAIALKMNCINQENLLRRQLISGESKTARRRERAARFPILRPGAYRRQPAGNRNLLRLLLSFARRKVGTNIHFKSRERLHREAGFLEIAHLFEADNIRIDRRDVRVHRPYLSSFFSWRRIGPAPWKPFHVPEGSRDGVLWRRSRSLRKRPRAGLSLQYPGGKLGYGAKKENPGALAFHTRQITPNCRGGESLFKDSIRKTGRA